MTSACDIHSKIFVHPELAKLVDECEEEWGMHSPINQMSKLRLVTKQCKSLALLVWVMTTIIDSVRSGDYQASSVNYNNMK